MGPKARARRVVLVNALAGERGAPLHAQIWGYLTPTSG